MRLSLHDPKKLGEKYVDQPELWIKTEKLVRDSLEKGKFNFVEIPGEAAFYGPKIDEAIKKVKELVTNFISKLSENEKTNINKTL